MSSASAGTNTERTTSVQQDADGDQHAIAASKTTGRSTNTVNVAASTSPAPVITPPVVVRPAGDHDLQPRWYAAGNLGAYPLDLLGDDRVAPTARRSHRSPAGQVRRCP